MSLEKKTKQNKTKSWQKNRAVQFCKLHADNSGSQTDITNNGSTLTKCPPENTGLLLSEILKDPPIV